MRLVGVCHYILFLHFTDRVVLLGAPAQDVEHALTMLTIKGWSVLFILEDSSSFKRSSSSISWFISAGRMEWEMDTQIDTAATLMQMLPFSLVGKRELAQ